MRELAQWVTEHIDSLIQAASVELSSDEALRATVEEAIAAFYQSLAHSAAIDDVLPIRAILLDWVEARSAPTDEEPTGLLPVLTTLKRVACQQICQLTVPVRAVQLLMASEALFTTDSNYLASLDAEEL